MTRQRSIKSFEPTIIDPTGAPNPLLRQNYGIKLLRNVSHVPPEIDRRIEDSGTVQVYQNSGFMGPVADFFCDLSRINCTASHVMGVFQRDQRRLGAVVDLFSNRRSNFVPNENAIRRSNQPGQDSAESGHRSHFIVVNMPGGFADNLLAS